MENTHFNSTGQPHRTFYYQDTTQLALLLTGVCLGFPGLVGIIFSFCFKCLDSRKLSVFLVSLLFTAVLQSLSTPVVAMYVMGSSCSLTYCFKLFAVWFASRHCGTLLHLLLALEFILSLTQPRSGARLRSVYWSLPLVLTLDLLSLLFFEVREGVIALGAMATSIALITCILVCTSKFTYKSQLKVPALAVVSFAVTYCPSFVMECILFSNGTVDLRLYDIFTCVTNLRLITDACLCWLVCRSPLRELPQQTDMVLENPGLRQE